MAEAVSVQAWVDRRNLAFESGDLLWAARVLPKGARHTVIEMAFHKARFDCLDVSDEMRRESQQWLAENNVKSLHGKAVAVGDPLPK